jgi:hypothetical protein
MHIKRPLIKPTSYVIYALDSTLWKSAQCSQKLYECSCHPASALCTNFPLSSINLSLCSLASSTPIGSALLSSSRCSRTISSNSTGSEPVSAISTSPLDPVVVTPLSWSRVMISTGSFASAALRASRVPPRSDSLYQESCCGGTLAVLMTRLVGSISQSATKRRWPGFVGSMSLKGETRC